MVFYVLEEIQFQLGLSPTVRMAYFLMYAYYEKNRLIYCLLYFFHNNYFILTTSVLKIDFIKLDLILYEKSSEFFFQETGCGSIFC